MGYKLKSGAFALVRIWGAASALERWTPGKGELKCVYTAITHSMTFSFRLRGEHDGNYCIRMKSSDELMVLSIPGVLPTAFHITMLVHGQVILPSCCLSSKLFHAFEGYRGF